jgi:hypothetical protein
LHIKERGPDLGSTALPMPVSIAAEAYQFDPLLDPRWPEFVARHSRSSFYHSLPWLESLRRTYGYKPVAITTSPQGSELKNAVVFCGVRSWLTGRRAVSLPFSDHCDPLVETDEEFAKLIGFTLESFRSEKWKYAELRPRTPLQRLPAGFDVEKHYCFHVLDLGSDLKQLYSSLHRDCIQRKIKRGTKEGLQYREGHSADMVAAFYRLFIKTRQKHGVPPPPIEWFLNLAQCFGPALQVRIALYRETPIASILTIVHRGTITYKYGCSDPGLNRLGGTPWLFWKVIQEAKAAGLRELDLGRSEWGNRGLIAFKDRLGAKRVPVTYWRIPKSHGLGDRLVEGKVLSLAGAVLRHMPQSILTASGRFLYRHVG